MMHIRNLFLIGLLVAGCSKKHDDTTAAGSAAPAAPAAPAAAATPPAASSADCDICRKADACCLAVDPDEAKNPVSCTRATKCDAANSSSDMDVQMRKDLVETCKDRLDGWRKDHPDVAACK